MSKSIFIIVFLFLLHSAKGQNVGIGTNTPQALLHVADKSVVFTGLATLPANPGAPPVAGNGNRMMWYADKAAFRVGGVTGSNWDRVYVGNYSVGLGFNSMAKGDYSIAMGSVATADGDFSMAAGYSTKASGNYSTALGHNTTASGNYSTALGYNTIANDDYSTALGYITTASGKYSTASGYITTASGEASTAFGIFNFASGNYSTVFGHNSSAAGLHSIAAGYNSIAGGITSTAIGDDVNANGDYSTALGFHAAANGNYSTATGSFTIADGDYSNAMGFSTKAYGWGSTALGLRTVANGASSLVAGLYNDPLISQELITSPQTPLLIIGNGADEDNRSNAMIVRYDGHVGIGTNTPRVKLHIANGSDADYSNDAGYVVVGSVNSNNLVIDNNEIIARNNGGSSVLYLQSPGGCVALGVTSTDPPVTHLLEVNGTAGKPGGGSWVNYSDARLKQDISPYTDGLSSLMKINPVRFRYNGLSGYDTKPTYVGVIAQELQKISPYMVTETTRKEIATSTGYLEVDNSAMTYMLINAVKEQQKQIEELKAMVKELSQKK